MKHELWNYYIYSTSLNIQNYKFITVIGNHCTAKTIIMRGYGALIPVKIIYVGDSNNNSNFNKALLQHGGADVYI